MKKKRKKVKDIKIPSIEKIISTIFFIGFALLTIIFLVLDNEFEVTNPLCKIPINKLNPIKIRRILSII